MSRNDFLPFRKQLLHLGASQGSTDYIDLSKAKFCYLTKEQSDEWIRIGTFSNVHTHSPEVQILTDHVSDLALFLKKRMHLVDLGCGDGKKIPPLIKALSSKVCIDGYLAIDTNKYLLKTALSHIKDNTGLMDGNYFSYQVDFEDIKISEVNKFFPGSARLYTFLGNTFNNFPREQITNILCQLVSKDDHVLLIGVKTRVDSSLEEKDRLISEYSSYGPRFTYSYGHILGLTDEQMVREVTYNSTDNRVDIWLRILQPSAEMIDAGLSNCSKILAGYRFVPTIDELSLWLSKYFDLAVFSNITKTNAIFCCQKSRLK